jgi:endonuclease G
MATDRRRVHERQVEVWFEATRRWEEQAPIRAANKRKIDARQPVDEPHRIMAFARREAERPRSTAAFRAVVRAALERPEDLAGQVRFLERRIGSSLDWSVMPSGIDAEAAGRPVARLCSSPEATEAVGFATGFMVSPALLLTNHHVFEGPADAAGMVAQFGYEERNGRTQAGTFFELDPETFFATDRKLDFALVGVKPTAIDGTTALAEMGHLRLIAETGKLLTGHPIVVIQHPDGQTKKYAERDNRLLAILDGHLQYSTDTLQGSSGSPCFNRAWEVVALHHSGVPLVTGGKVQSRNGGPWDASMGDDEIAWVSNEGIRISRLVDHLTRLKVDPAKTEQLRQLFEAAPPPSGEAPSEPEQGQGPEQEHPIWHIPAQPGFSISNGSASEATMATTIINIYGNPTLYLGAAAGPERQRDAATALPDRVEKKLTFDPDYAARKGYKARFLGVEIPLPGVAARRRGEMLKGVNGRVLVLKYHHFSLAMNRRRRFQMWSAVNVDYSEAAREHAFKRDSFGTDTWTLDPRIPASMQVQDAEFYQPATNVDRGHVVRREDNCWGATERATELANSDTFHWTNCTPQHERFNQSRQFGLWGRLEDVVKDRAEAEGGPGRLSVFAGPVLSDGDPEAFGIHYPVKFWKVVAAVIDGQLEAHGFVLDQTPVVEQFGLEETLDFGKFEVHQVALDEIQELTGLVFPQVLLDADTMQGHQPIEVKEPGKVTRAPIGAVVKFSRAPGGPIRARSAAAPAKARKPSLAKRLLKGRLTGPRRPTA